jgi:hypothetical protein
LTSGKRNDFENLDIVEVECSWSLRSDNGKRDAARPPARCLQFFLYASEYELFNGTSFAGSLSFEFSIKRIRDVDRGAHEYILPYLWLAVNWNVRLVQQGKPAERIETIRIS